MPVVRPMDFGGAWYPRGEEACEARIREYWERPIPRDQAQGALGVAPHAGWLYSGAVAARVYQMLQGGSEVELVVILGGHLGAADPLLAMTEDSWDTPFGPFRIHRDFQPQLKAFPHHLQESGQKYRPDNSTELQLPFAKLKFPNAELLPIRVPPAGMARELGRVLGEYIASNNLKTVAVASTDLTHYGSNYGFQPMGNGAQALDWMRNSNDAAFIQAMQSGEAQGVLESAASHRNACSAGAVAAVMELARGWGLKFSPLDYATSAEAGPRDRHNFVGYVGGVFC